MRVSLSAAVGKGARIALTAAIVCAAGSVRANPPLFLVDTPFDPVPSGIYLVNTDTGALTLKASIPVSYGAMLGLAAANDHVLYATGSDSNGCFSCFLYRITLDPASTTPLEILPIGPLLDGTTPIVAATGLTFREDGTLWMNEEDTHGLYVVDPSSGASTRIGTLSVEVVGGDVTFDADDTLWMWTNTASGHGLYSVSTTTAFATLIYPQSSLRLAGVAAVGHSYELWGASPFNDSIEQILIPSGFTGVTHPLTFGGLNFDHKRGDLDSPYCSNDLACDDQFACTTDSCTPGGCANAPIPNCCVSNLTCGDGISCTDDVCDLSGETGVCTHVPNDGACDDGIACTADACGPTGCENVPIAGCCTSDLECGDGNPCTDDVCDLSGPMGVCTNPPNTDPCDDGNACTGGDVCSGGACQPGSPLLPGEATGLLADADKTTFTWDPQADATSFDVVRGLVAALPVGPGGEEEICFPDLSAPTLVDTSEPLEGELFWYLVRGESVCGVGSYGTWSDGTPRVTTTCP